jgi:predicted nuclease with RNAse H fold
VIDWRNVALLGIDVGFSKQRNTTGIASYRSGHEISLHCVGSLAQHRADVLRDGSLYNAIAIDGPIVPVPNRTAQIVRRCERVLSRGMFGQRCKPGFSHFGTGLQLRQAATTIALEMPFQKRTASAPVVEAFPNAFLGVMLDDDAYREMGRIPRGKKSDVFFKRAVTDRAFDRLFHCLQWETPNLKAQIAAIAEATTRISHEHRAAIVCVMTAACALSTKAQTIGDDVGGHICLPPLDVWADWAKRELAATLSSRGNASLAP